MSLPPDVVSALSFVPTVADQEAIANRTSIADASDWLQSALDYCAANHKRLLVNGGRWVLHKPVTIPDRVSVWGEGPAAVGAPGTGGTLIYGVGQINLFEIGTGGANNPADVELAWMTLTYNDQQTTSQAVLVRNGHNINLHDLRFSERHNVALELDGGVNAYIYNVERIEIGAGNYGLVIGRSGRVQELFTRAITTGGVAETAILALDVSGWYASDLSLLSGKNALKTFPGPNQIVAALQSWNLVLDSCSGHGLWLTTDGGTVSTSVIGGSWIASCGLSNLRIDENGGAITALTFTGGRIYNGAREGIDLVSGSDLEFTGVQIGQNSQSGSASYAGVKIGAGAARVKFVGGGSGDIGTFPTNNQSYGATVAAGATGIAFEQFSTEGNVTGSISDAGAGTKIANCPGCVTRASATAAIAVGTSSIVVSHGLAFTPQIHDLQAWPVINLGLVGVGHIWISEVTATTFKIFTDQVVTSGTAYFAWRASAKGG
jgi:hypothetical protein